MKVCTQCKLEKPLAEIHKDKTRKNDLSSWCEECYKKYQNKYQEKYRKTEKSKSYHKEWEKTPKRKEYNKNRQKKRRQTLRYKNWYEKNKNEIIKRTTKNAKKRKQTDIGFKLSCNLRLSLWKALRGKIKTGSAIRDLGCTLKELKEHLEKQFIEGMSWDNYGCGQDKWTIDHKIAMLDKDIDLTKREDLLRVCHYTNLQPMWFISNIQKGNRRV